MFKGYVSMGVPKKGLAWALVANWAWGMSVVAPCLMQMLC